MSDEKKDEGAGLLFKLNGAFTVEDRERFHEMLHSYSTGASAGLTALCDSLKREGALIPSMQELVASPLSALFLLSQA